MTQGQDPNPGSGEDGEGDTNGGAPESHSELTDAAENSVDASPASPESALSDQPGTSLPSTPAPAPEPVVAESAAPAAEPVVAGTPAPAAEPVAESAAPEPAPTVAAATTAPEVAPVAEAVVPEPAAAELAPAAETVARAPEAGAAETVAPESAAVPEPVVDEAPAVAAESAPAAPEPASATAAEAPAIPAPSPASAAPVPGAAPGPQVGDKPSGPPVPGSAPKAPRPTGRVLEGAVIAVSPEEVELRLDDGRTGVINRRNFGPDDEDPTSVLSVGDRAFGAELAREDPKSRVVLSRVWALKKQAWDRVLEAANANTPLQGKVTSLGAKGLVVDVGVRGFVPSSHLELEPVSDLEPYRDQTLDLKVLEADPQKERLVLSRRSLLLKDQRKKAQQLLSSLTPGETCRGTVTSITNYGAFVDIGGVNGLVHLSELSWKRVRRPNDVVALGDEIEVRILDVKAKKKRVSLSLRQMQPDPLSQLEVGEIRQGPVTRLVDFGAFVSLGDVEGLVHLSELAEYRVSSPAEVVAPGDEVGVKILSIDKKRRRVELSIRRAAEFGG